MERHKSLKHTDDPHTCNLCGREVRNIEDAKYHLRNNHREEFDENVKSIERLLTRVNSVMQ